MVRCVDYASTGTFGPAYDPAIDGARIQRQMRDVFNLMADGKWRTLHEISATLGHPEASVSAQLRHLRKARFGGHVVDKRRRSAEGGTWEYHLPDARKRIDNAVAHA